MFKISKKVIYAIEAVVDVACHSGINPVQNLDIAKRQGIPKRYLEQTLQNLVKHNILIGSRGPKGGYRLAKERRKINLSQIVNSVEENSFNSIKNKLMVSEVSKKAINPLIIKITRSCYNSLEKITVEDIYKKINANTSKKKAVEQIDFFI